MTDNTLISLSKADVLSRAKRQATAYLVVAAIVFLITLFLKLPQPWGIVIELVKAMAEAAMIGGMADWFAVSALFRPVNLLGFIPVFPSHTNVIPHSKEKIASSLAGFVQDHFLAPETLVQLVKGHDPVQWLAKWFLDEENAKQFGRHSVKVIRWALNGLHDDKMQELIGQMVQRAVNSIDLSRSTGEILDALLQDGQHHELLDEIITRLMLVLRDPETRNQVAERIASTIRAENPVVQKILPTEAMGRAIVGGAANWIDSYLADVAHKSDHDLRKLFDAKAKYLIERLKNDPELTEKGERIKDYILKNENFTAYMRNIWTHLRDLLEDDLSNSNSEIHRRLVNAGSWVGKTLEGDKELRNSLNRQFEDLVQQFGPGLGSFVAQHIEGTIQSWDSQDMSTLLEENIGTDLQKIRINGTLIGGLLGGGLFIITTLAHWIH